MKRLKIVKIDDESLIFDDGTIIKHYHENQCCEDHYLSFSDISVSDFKDMYFDLSSDSFFCAVKDYGIKLVAIDGTSISIPGYGSNNGHYSEKLHLQIITPGGDVAQSFDISECQSIDYY